MFEDIKSAFIDYFQHLMHGKQSLSNETISFSLKDHDDELIESVFKFFSTFQRSFFSTFQYFKASTHFKCNSWCHFYNMHFI